MGASCTCTVRPVVLETRNRIQLNDRKYIIKKRVRGDRRSEMSISSRGTSGEVYILQLSAVLFDPINCPQWVDFVLDKCIVIVYISLDEKPFLERKGVDILSCVNIDWGNFFIIQQVPRVSSISAGSKQIFGVLSKNSPAISPCDRITLRAKFLGIQEIALSTEVKTDKEFLLDDVTAMYQCFVKECEFFSQKHGPHFNCLDEKGRKVSASSRRSSLSKRDSLHLDVIEEEQECIQDISHVNSTDEQTANLELTIKKPGDREMLTARQCKTEDHHSRHKRHQRDRKLEKRRNEKQTTKAVIPSYPHSVCALIHPNEPTEGATDLYRLGKDYNRGGPCLSSGAELTVNAFPKKEKNSTDDDKKKETTCKQLKLKARKLTPIIKNGTGGVLRISTSREPQLYDLTEEDTERHFPFDFSASDVWENDTISFTSASTPSRFNVSPFSLK